MEYIDDGSSMGAVVNMYINFIGIFSGKKNHFEDVIIFGGITVFRQILNRYEDVQRICLVRDTHQWRTFMNTVMNFQIP